MARECNSLSCTFCVTISVVDLTKKGTFRKEVINSIQPDGKMSEMAETSATTAGGPPFSFSFFGNLGEHGWGAPSPTPKYGIVNSAEVACYRLERRWTLTADFMLTSPINADVIFIPTGLSPLNRRPVHQRSKHGSWSRSRKLHAPTKPIPSLAWQGVC